MAKQTNKGINFKSWLIAILRRATYKWPPRYKTLNNSRVERGIYKCSICQKNYSRKNVVVDHINPVVRVDKENTDFNNPKDIGDYILRMFVMEDGWQTLCRECHDIKSTNENNQRKLNKKLTTKVKKDNINVK